MASRIEILIFHFSLIFLLVLESVDSVEPDFEYRMSMLPSWAQREAVGGIPSVGVGEGTEQMAAPVEGRWAEVRGWVWRTVTMTEYTRTYVLMVCLHACSLNCMDSFN